MVNKFVSNAAAWRTIIRAHDAALIAAPAVLSVAAQVQACPIVKPFDIGAPGVDGVLRGGGAFAERPRSRIESELPSVSRRDCRKGMTYVG
jgi:hypothetical protein